MRDRRILPNHMDVFVGSRRALDLEDSLLNEEKMGVTRATFADLTLSGTVHNNRDGNAEQDGASGERNPGREDIASDEEADGGASEADNNNEDEPDALDDGLSDEDGEYASMQSIDNITRRTVLRTGDNRFLVVHHCVSDSPIHAICAATSTCLINFVGAQTFGCGYPALTLRRQSLVRPSMCNTEEQDAELDKLQVTHGFRPGRYAGDFEQYPNVAVAEDCETYPCTRWMFLCPLQARFFGDHGSLTGIFDPLRTSEESLRDSRCAPYGVTAVWRFYVGDWPCDGRCEERDPLLAMGVQNMVAVIIQERSAFQYDFVGRQSL